EILFLAEFHCKDEIEHIVVRRKNQLCWQSQLSLGHSYRITQLRCDTLYKNSHNIDVHHTTRTSTLTELEDINQCDTSTSRKELLSYSGIVTKIIDNDIGLYELDSRIQLFTCYLRDITGELRDSKTNGIKIGEKLKIFNVHYLKDQGKINLICCGRSLIVKEKPFDVNPECVKSSSGVLHALHLYNLGSSGLHWLLYINEQLTQLAVPHLLHQTSSTGKCFEGRNGVLIRILTEASSRGLLVKQPRSPILEFLAHHIEPCVIAKVFCKPFIVKSISEVLYADQTSCTGTNENSSTNNILWHHASNGSDGNILVGKLELDENGYLLLCDKNTQVAIVLVGVSDIDNYNFQNDTLIHKIGSFVAIFNWKCVTETFNILIGKENQSRRILKEYIMVKGNDIIVLQKRNLKNQLVFNGEEYKVKLLNKSGFVFSIPQNSNSLSTDAHLQTFFIVHAIVNKSSDTCHASTVKERWRTFIKITGDNSKMFPCLQEGMTFAIKIPLDENQSQSLMKRSYSFSYLSPLFKYFGNTECIDLPANSHIFSCKGNSSFLSNSITISKLLENESQFNSELVSVVGVVIDRQHMTDRFARPTNDLHLDIINQKQIGIPKDKVLRVLLQDIENSAFQMWVYLTCRSKNNIHHYPFGILPGCKICISNTKKHVSKVNKLTYLQGTEFTTITPLSFSTPNHYAITRPIFSFLRDTK
ncbi:unnamed protein product, partial [Meganyctiphanes norvegica]